MLREVSQTVADELIYALPADQPFDLVSNFAVPMPVRIICRMLDVRVDDVPMLGAEVGQMVLSLEVQRSSVGPRQPAPLRPSGPSRSVATADG